MADMLLDFTYDHDGERLSGVYGGDHPGAVAQGATASGAGTSGVTAVLLHGAGNGSKERLLPLVREFAAHGCRCLAFDFSGHGQSTGKLAELSLRRRFEQAVAVIDAYARGDGPLILVGFSMSGQTVADLVAHYGDRVAALGLCAPAVYAAQAWDVPFGDGNGRFSGIIRRPDSWRDAPALRVLRAYEGRAVLAVPGTDAVIPPEVTEAVQDALAARAQFTRFDLPEAQHQLGVWFRDHDDDRRAFVETVLTGLDRRVSRDGTSPAPTGTEPCCPACGLPMTSGGLVLTRREDDRRRVCRSVWRCAGRHVWWRWADRPDEPLEVCPIQGRP